ncbi:hypothetical protein QE152_g25204 [Popillia japonica]|uniref:Polyprotein n=1 Tax=Popillia japonica TaxID=7064 RepID=A0AAW1K2D1_POPJA
MDPKQERQLLAWYEELEREDLDHTNIEDINIDGDDDNDSDIDNASLVPIDYNSTDSEMEISDDAVEQPQDSDELCFAAKSDKVSIKWRKHPKTRAVKTASVNKVSVRAGVKEDAKQALSILDCWRLYFDQDTIQKIVTFTNIQIDKFREKYARERDARSTNTEEIEALLGALYAAGVLKSSHVCSHICGAPSQWFADRYIQSLHPREEVQKMYTDILKS